MDRWLKRKNFKARVKGYREASGKTLQDVADDLQISQSYLHALLYRENTDPSEELKAKAAEVFGCSVIEFTDDPGEPIPGLDAGDAATLSAAKRAVMNMMFQRLRRDDVTDEDALEYYKDLMYLVERGTVRKPRWE